MRALIGGASDRPILCLSLVCPRKTLLRVGYGTPSSLAIVITLPLALLHCVLGVTIFAIRLSGRESAMSRPVSVVVVVRASLCRLPIPLLGCIIGLSKNVSRAGDRRSVILEAGQFTQATIAGLGVVNVEQLRAGEGGEVLHDDDPFLSAFCAQQSRRRRRAK